MNRNATTPLNRAAKRIASGMPANPDCGDASEIVIRPCSEAEIVTIMREELAGIDPAIAADEGKELNQ